MFRIQPSRTPSGMTPEGFGYPPDSAATFAKGALVTLDAQGEVAEHAGGVTVIDVLGIAMEGCAAGVSDNPSGDVEVAVANRETHFIGGAYDTGAPTEDVSAVILGETYGLIKHTDGVWYVDLDDTTNVLVQITKIIQETNLNVLQFKFLESTLQQP